MLATVIDTQALLDTVLAALISGIGVTVIFSLAIFAAARFGEMSREGRTGAAAAYGAATAVTGVAFAAAITIGIIVMTTK
jgi:hypothetical protein